MEKALFPGQDGSTSQIRKVVCLVGVTEIFCTITDILPTPGVLQLSLIPDQRMSPLISLRLNPGFVGVIVTSPLAFHLSSLSLTSRI